MYTIRDTVYSDAGKMLVGDRRRGYQFKGQESDFSEVALSLDDMELHDGYVTYSGIVQGWDGSDDYGHLKAQMVKRRYSNDDQIAIIINKDSGDPADIMRYDKMNEWREWSGRVASKIIELINA